MRFSTVIRTGALIADVLVATACLRAQTPEAPGRDVVGMPPRASATEYQAQAKAGSFTIAAEFTGHAVATPEGIFSAEEYVTVEAAVFGSPGAKLKLSSADFSLRINGKKTALPNQPYEIVFKSLKDPEWEPPAAQKSKTSIGGNGGEKGEPPPSPPKMPIELRRAMEQKVQKVCLPPGERELPQAGLLFFQFRGKTDNLKSVELIYEGPAGAATVSLVQQ